MPLLEVGYLSARDTHLEEAYTPLEMVDAVHRQELMSGHIGILLGSRTKCLPVDNAAIYQELPSVQMKLCRGQSQEVEDVADGATEQEVKIIHEH